MTISRYQINWLGRCQYGTEDKIWGWFFYDDTQTVEPKSRINQPKYYFWAHTGKTIQFRRHESWYSKPETAVKAKKAVKYQDTEIEDLIKIWPTFKEDLDRHFIFFMLQNGS